MEGGRSVGRDQAMSALLLLAVLCVLAIMGYFVNALVTGAEPVRSVVAVCLLVAFSMALVYLALNPEALRSQYAEQTLVTASGMLEDIRDGLTRESAQAICERLLPLTHAVTVAVTDTSCVLACAGAHRDDFAPGSPIHTPATHYAIDHGLVQSFTHATATSAAGGEFEIPAGIIAPLKVSGRAIGTLKFYFRSPGAVNRTQYALAEGYAELLSTQLATHELELQEELTARAEVRALQAQINPHFLFNTLNTIAAFTRTDPLRARELLREFSAFYRATLDNSGSLIPVSREVAQTERYLMFEKARFGEDRIVDHMEVEPEATEALVPAFIIQPLVENAVRHAMRDEGPLTISVRVRRDGPDTLAIEVQDDGVGMDAQTAERLFDGAPLAPGDTKRPQGGGAGVAMRNISDRIKRFYGPRSSARVVSEPDHGTTVSLHLDLKGSIFT